MILFFDDLNSARKELFTGQELIWRDALNREDGVNASTRRGVLPQNAVLSGNLVHLSNNFDDKTKRTNE